MYILDTDHIGVLQRQSEAGYQTLSRRIAIQGLGPKEHVRSNRIHYFHNRANCAARCRTASLMV